MAESNFNLMAMNTSNNIYSTFISYRKSASVNAELIRDRLINNWAYTTNDIFLDNHSIYNEDYKAKIKTAISKSRSLTLVVTKDCFIPKSEGTDFYIFEIKEAIRQNIPIIPILFDGIKNIENDATIMSTLSKSFSNAEIDILSSRECIRYDNDYGTASIEKLHTFISRPINPNQNSDKINIWKVFGTLLASIIIFFGIFFTAGLAWGYFSNSKECQEVWNEARANRGVMMYYDVDTNQSFISIQIDNEQWKYYYQSNKKLEKVTPDENFFEKIPYENITFSTMFPLAITSAFKAARYTSDGRGKIIAVIGITIGTVCGFYVGKTFGELVAELKFIQEFNIFLKTREIEQELDQMSNKRPALHD